MKKRCFPPLAVLAALLLFSLWNSAALAKDTARWQSQLDHAAALARAEDWSAAADALEESYQDWSRRQGYLRTVTQHQAIDSAQAMYCRALAFAAVQEPNEFQAELAGLHAQLALLAEMERPTLQNIL